MNIKPKNSLEKEILANEKYSLAKKEALIRKIRDQNLNILIVGATGAGKSSTINALFNFGIAKKSFERAGVGHGASPKTYQIQKFGFDNLTLWDTPGLGDCVDADRLHKAEIGKKLNEKKDDGDCLIDLVLVIIDGSSRDLGTPVELINNTIIPNLGESADSRLLVGINQADVAKKDGSGWDHSIGLPTDEGTLYLEEVASSIAQRIYASTRVSVDPVYYSAGFDGRTPYNIGKLLCRVIEATPVHKRVAYLGRSLNRDSGKFKVNDSQDNYIERAKDGLGLGKIISGIFGFFTGLFGL